MPLQAQGPLGCRMTVQNFVKIVWTVFEKFEIFMKRSGEKKTKKKQHDCISSRKFFPTPKNENQENEPESKTNIRNSTHKRYRLDSITHKKTIRTSVLTRERPKSALDLRLKKRDCGKLRRTFSWKLLFSNLRLLTKTQYRPNIASKVWKALESAKLWILRELL